MTDLKRIGYAEQIVEDEDIEAVTQYLQGGMRLTQAAINNDFENAISEVLNVKHCVLTNSATSALLSAYLACGLGPNDLLWTVPNTFVATANAALQCGATVEFVDICPRTQNLCLDLLESKLADAKIKGILPKIVVPVHFGGSPVDLNRLQNLSNAYGFLVVEDASHALGATYAGSQIGNGVYSEATIFSFHPAKGVTTGEGGCVVTNNRQLAARVRRITDHGLQRDPQFFEETSNADLYWPYQQIEMGYNFRMPALSSVLGLSQLKRLPKFLGRRRCNAEVYKGSLAPSVTRQEIIEGCESSYHLFPVLFQSADHKKHIKMVLARNGIDAAEHYLPVYLQPYYYKMLKTAVEDYCPESLKCYSTMLSLPCHAGLSNTEIRRIVELINAEI